jgi:hypothetical protein
MTIYEQIALKIIREQELLMGPVAWFTAGKVVGLKIIDRENGIISIESEQDASEVINNLVAQFGKLFGRAGREVCKDAVSALVGDLQPTQVPSSLV